MSNHYENMPIFLVFAQNIDCVYTLEPPRRGSSNEYPQSMFWSNNRKIGIHLHTPVLLYESGVQGGYTEHGHVFVMYHMSKAMWLQELCDVILYLLESVVSLGLDDTPLYRVENRQSFNIKFRSLMYQSPSYFIIYWTICSCVNF